MSSVPLGLASACGADRNLACSQQPVTVCTEGIMVHLKGVWAHS